MTNGHAADSSPARSAIQGDVLCFIIGIGDGNAFGFHFRIPGGDGIQPLQVFGQPEGDLVVPYNGADVGIGGQLVLGQGFAVVSGTGQGQVFIHQPGHITGNIVCSITGVSAVFLGIPNSSQHGVFPLNHVHGIRILGASGQASQLTGVGGTTQTVSTNGNGAQIALPYGRLGVDGGSPGTICTLCSVLSPNPGIPATTYIIRSAPAGTTRCTGSTAYRGMAANCYASGTATGRGSAADGDAVSIAGLGTVTDGHGFPQIGQSCIPQSHTAGFPGMGTGTDGNGIVDITPVIAIAGTGANGNFPFRKSLRLITGSHTVFPLCFGFRAYSRSIFTAAIRFFAYRYCKTPSCFCFSAYCNGPGSRSAGFFPYNGTAGPAGSSF